jgi:hypothetical protein
LAGTEPEWPLDGRSLFADEEEIEDTYPEEEEEKEAGAPTANSNPSLLPPRELFLIEYWGQWVDDNKTFFGDCQTFGQGFIHDCRNNTYHGVRLLNRTHNFMYAEWVFTDFVELYNLATDPLQLHNLACDPRATPLRQELARSSIELLTCSGERCNMLSDRRRTELVHHQQQPLLRQRELPRQCSTWSSKKGVARVLGGGVKVGSTPV